MIKCKYISREVPKTKPNSRTMLHSVLVTLLVALEEFVSYLNTRSAEDIKFIHELAVKIFERGKRG